MNSIIQALMSVPELVWDLVLARGGGQEGPAGLITGAFARLAHELHTSRGTSVAPVA